jgi:hypothetical protein
MVAIKTYYLGPTNYKPSRYVATAHCGAIRRMVESVDSALDSNLQQALLAAKLAAANNWVGEQYGPLVGGDFEDCRVHVFKNSAY